jgi:hypothetical protein
VASAEVLAARLTLTPAALAQAVEDAGLPELQLASGDGAEVVRGASRLSFQRDGEALSATALVVAEDRDSLFTLRFLAPLFQRHRGDLHLLLSWEGGGEVRELRIDQGRAATPGLPPVPPATQAASLTSAEEREVRELLDTARRHWEEYQRLKAEAAKDDTL